MTVTGLLVQTLGVALLDLLERAVGEDLFRVMVVRGQLERVREERQTSMKGIPAFSCTVRAVCRSAT